LTENSGAGPWLAKPITTQFRLTNAQFASLTAWFLVTYSLSLALLCKLYGRIGNKRGFAASIIAWNIYLENTWFENIWSSHA
jgi:hypothetical protein